MGAVCLAIALLVFGLPSSACGSKDSSGTALSSADSSLSVPEQDTDTKAALSAEPEPSGTEEGSDGISDEEDGASGENDSKEETESTEESTAESAEEESAAAAEPDFTVTEADGTMYAVTPLNVRTGPGTSYDITGYLSYGEAVEITGKCDNGWMQIIYDSKTAYASGRYLSDTKPSQEASASSASSSSASSSSGYTNGILTAESGVSGGMVSSVESYYNMVPSNVRAHFENSGWSITIVSGNLNNRFGYSYSIQAITVYAESKVYIDNRSTAADSIIHEMGHHIDDASGNPSQTQEFADIRNSELSAFTSFWSTHSNNTGTASEYFAEAYQAAILESGTMASKCPETYEFVMKYSDAL